MRTHALPSRFSASCFDVIDHDLRAAQTPSDATVDADDVVMDPDLGPGKRCIHLRGTELQLSIKMDARSGAILAFATRDSSCEMLHTCKHAQNDACTLSIPKAF